ncbi:MAG: outer membrane beta-barrel protein [Verrucomicrobiota bacterium]|nr:outer membrane beta-barrel protein [Verrucomicrobiota bacterium]
MKNHVWRGAFLFLVCCSPVSGQEMATPSTAAAQTTLIRVAGQEVEDYNFKIGPVLFNLSAGLSIEYNDNVSYSGGDGSRDPDRGLQDRSLEIDRQRALQEGELESESDIIISPYLGVDARWPISRLNALTISVGLGYTKYLYNDDLDSSSLIIAPNSIISFDIFVGGIRINVHDSFSVQQDPVDEGSLSGVGKFGRFENTAGFIVYLPIRREWTLTLGYDHHNLFALSSEFDDQTSSADSFHAELSYLVMPALTVGINGSLTFNRYEGDLNNDSVSYFTGAFADFTLSHNLSGRVQVGWQSGTFSDTGENADTSGLGTWYANFTLNHRLNRYYQQSLGFGREASLGFETNFTEVNYLQYTGVLTLFSGFNLNLNAFFEDAEESGGIFAESYKRWGGGLGFQYQLTRKVTAGFSYDYLTKDSNFASNDYDQNRYLVTFTYDF